MTMRERSGETVHRVSAAEIAMYMKGIDFPASKQDIISKAKQNGAPDHTMQWFNRLPEKQYRGPTEVEEEFGKLK